MTEQEMTIRPVDEDSVEACASLKCREEQIEFTNSPVWSLLQTAYTSIAGKCKLYAVWHREQVVGMVRLDFTLHDGYYMFTNLLIHRDHQRKHYGENAVARVLEEFRRDGRYDRVKLHVAPGNAGAIALYEKVGFRCLGKTADGNFLEYAIEI